MAYSLKKTYECWQHQPGLPHAQAYLQVLLLTLIKHQRSKDLLQILSLNVTEV